MDKGLNELELKTYKLIYNKLNHIICEKYYDINSLFYVFLVKYVYLLCNCELSYFNKHSKMKCPFIKCKHCHEFGHEDLICIKKDNINISYIDELYNKTTF